MYIKSIEIDGFKSYARRTEIKDFDRLFNAITGLNGSGKSNILDSICFLLGITTLGYIRANNLTELVYKNGQAGITRATVSIVFDNRDKDNSPMGYHSHDEITVTRQINIGGKNKYLINGINAQNNRVADFFHSVGLNINNPHFLIMQGRVTKVMNMKPMEILSMIEEATGTKMYESKRENCRKNIEKKTMKWTEMTNILTQELEPKIAKLKEDRESYLQYQQISREIEQNEKIVIAYKFMLLDKKLEGADEEKSSLENKLQEAIEKRTNLTQKLEGILAQIEQMEQQNEEEKGSKLEELNKELNDLRKDEAKKLTSKKTEEDKLKQQQKRITAQEKQIKTHLAQIEKKQADREQMSNSHEQNTADAEQAEAEYEKANTMLEQLRLGAAFGDGGTKTLADEAIEKRQIVSNKQSEIKNSQARVTKITGELRIGQLRQKASKANSSYTADNKKKEQVQNELAKVESELEKIDIDENEMNRLDQQIRHLEHEGHNLADQEHNFYRTFNKLDMDAFIDWRRFPQNFDKSRIKGFVANLIDVTREEFLPAIEKCASGKLYNLVVDSPDTAEFMLKNKLLKNRVTLIPLQGLRVGHPIDPRKARSLVGGDNADAAINCVSIAPEFDIVRQFVFNGVLVAKENKMAHDLCFNPEIRTKVISAKGDEFDPSGVIKGGHNANRQVLREVRVLKSIQDKLRHINGQLNDLNKRYSESEHLLGSFQRLQNQRQMMKSKLEQISERLLQSEFGRQQADIERLEGELVELEETLKTSKEVFAAAKKEAEEIENRMKNLEKNRDAELKRLEKEVNTKKRDFEAAKKKVDTMSGKYEALGMEIAALEKDTEAAEAELNAEKQKVGEVIKELEQHTKICSQADQDINAVKSKIQEQRALIEERKNEISEQRSLEKQTIKEIKESEQNVKIVQVQITKQAEQNRHENVEREKMLTDHDWIEKDKSMFGQVNSPYDFAFRDPAKAEKALRKGLKEKDKLTGQINQRAMALLAQAEKQYNELLEKRADVENDLDNIRNSMKMLDEKKKEKITSAYHEVNKSFGSIFSSLLPGANAKLSPCEGKTVLEGLEFKVGFGNTWKDNLSELSGGQRSLVALSLILAMLRLKPAPIYILDEVDAALDLSHTQESDLNKYLFCSH